VKRVSVKEYRRNMGILIDLDEPDKYSKKHLSGAKNIPYDVLIMNYRELLDKTRSYCLYCEKGRKSRRAVSMLELYGYNVTQVYYE